MSVLKSQRKESPFEVFSHGYKLRRAIAECFNLQQELQYAITTIPVDIDQYFRFDSMIQRQVTLIKSWYGSYKNIMSNQQKRNLNELFSRLFERELFYESV